MSAIDLRLVVDNLGPVAHADIALQPLTVLIGKNNTGKTYVAQALYAVNKAVNSYHLQPSDRLTTTERTTLQQLVLHQTETGRVHLPLPLQEKATAWLGQGLNEAGRAVSRNLHNYFGVSDLRDIARWGQPDEIAVGLYLRQEGGQRTSLFGTQPPTTPSDEILSRISLDREAFDEIRADLFYRHGHDDEREDFLNAEITWNLANVVWYEFLESVGLTGKAHYLPAGRSGLLHAWSDVVKLRFELERERYGLSTMPEPSLGGIALDFISSLADILGTRRRHRLHRLRRRQSNTRKETRDLLAELMGGRIRTGAADEMIPTLEYEQDGHRLAVHRASSMVADLAPLAMWIEHLVTPKDLLIIDEPESHLHPEAIRLIARVLVRLVNEGVRIVCATHSSVLLHELSNCILRHQLELALHGISRSKDEVIDSVAFDKVAVYRFVKEESTGSVQVSRERVEPYWGIPEEEYVEVATRQADDTAKLINQLP